jgi:thiol-disulfide isomerase/thioredoxin
VRNISTYDSGKAAWLLMAMFGLVVSGCDLFSSANVDVSGVELRTVNAAELDQVIRSQKGRVVLVDFWATWCPPCRQLFPHNMALQRQYADQGLTVVTVSLDSPARVANVKRFLLENPGGTLNFLANADDAQAANNPFGLGEGIPLIKIYDRQGNMQEPIVGRDEAAIDRTVQALLAER